jgi:hypothetical protein
VLDALTSSGHEGLRIAGGQLTAKHAHLGAGRSLQGGNDDSGSSPPKLAFVRMLIGGVVASRTGLWIFDLAVTQLVQEHVDAGELGEPKFKLFLLQSYQLLPSPEVCVESF